MNIAEERVPELCRRKWPTDSTTPATWAELEADEGIGRVEFRTQMRRYKAARPEEFRQDAPVLVESSGPVPETAMPDPDEAFRRACGEWERVARLETLRKGQRLTFDHGPIALVGTADWHLGAPGINYPRLDEDMRIIADTPGMYAIGCGDLLNQMIVGKLADARRNDRLNIQDEWALVRRMLAIIADKLLLVVMGNHDNWLEMLTGISYFERELHNLKPGVLYDTDDALVTVKVGGWELPTRVRHKWRGTSIYNPTHGIERAAKFDQRFLIGFGAHTHASGLARAFNVEGVTGMALLAGSYKESDAYARRQGFPTPNASASVAVVIDERNHSLTGFDDLQTCADYMDALYGN